MEILGVILAAARVTGVDPSIAIALAMRESRLDTTAKGKAGEVGVFQILPSTAKLVGFDGTPEQLTDTKTNALFALKHFANLFRKYGSIPQAVSAYQHGTPTTANQEYTADVLTMAARFKTAMHAGTIRAVLVPVLIGLGAFILAKEYPQTEEAKP
jgi:soluble lytic murein transglycosylase-like protein